MLNIPTVLFKWSLSRGGHKYNSLLVMHMKKCIQNNIFMLMADHVHIIIFGGLNAFGAICL